MTQRIWHGVQEGLFTETPTVVETRRESFFRRLARKNGAPEIRAEIVLIMRKEA